MILIRPFDKLLGVDLMISIYAASTNSKSVTIKSMLALTCMAAAIITQPLAASAQVIVVQSSAKGIKAGTLLPNDAKVAIPAGSKAVFVLPSGASRTVKGPFNGRAGDLTKGVKANPGVFDAVKRYVRTGGSTQKTVGAVRSAAPAYALGKPLPFSWHTVPVTTSGDFCVEKGASVSLVRTRTKNAQNITIIDMKSQRRVRVAFPAGAKSIAWPDDLNIDPGATYTLLTDGRPPREMRMRMITPLPEREDTLQVLHGQRCQTQFRAFIREMQAAG